MKAEDLVGTYIGRGQEHVAADGTVTRPQGRSGSYPSRIVYTKEGLVIVVSTPAGRERIAGKRIEDATPEELAKMVLELMRRERAAQLEEMRRILEERKRQNLPPLPPPDDSEE